MTSGNNITTTAIPTDWDGTTNHRLTFAAMSGNNAIGNTYTVATSEYNRALLRSAVNNALRECGAITQRTRGYAGTATSGSTTTCVDTACDMFAADYFNSGTILFTGDNNHWGVATITDFSATGTFTFTAQSDALASGDTFVAIPSGVSSIVRIEEDGYVNHFWNEVNGMLHFDEGNEPGGDFVIYYNKPHDALTTDAGVVNAALPVDYVLWHAVYQAQLLRFNLSRGDDKIVLQKIDLARQQMYNMKLKYRSQLLMPRDSRWSNWS